MIGSGSKSRVRATHNIAFSTTCYIYALGRLPNNYKEIMIFLKIRDFVKKMCTKIAFVIILIVITSLRIVSFNL